MNRKSGARKFIAMEIMKDLLSNINPKVVGEKEQKYVQGILAEEWKTNEDVGKAIWPKTNPKNRKTYLSRLKKNILEQTINNAILVKGKSPYQALTFDCWKRLAAVKILSGMGVRKGAAWLAKQTLKKALKCDLTEVALSMARSLVITESVSGSTKEYQYYRDLVDDLEEVFAAENKAIRYFTELSNHFANSKEVNAALIKRVQAYGEELSSEIDRFTTYRYCYFSYHIKATYAQLINDHKTLEKVCNQAILFFEAKPYPIPTSVKFSFTFKPISAALQLRDYTAAKEYISAARKLTLPRSYNEEICLIYQAILGFHSDQFDLVKDAIQSSRPLRKYKVVEEQWKIIEAYACFLDIDSGKKFRIKKFLNEVPIYSKDKRGNNISILILQILFHLKLEERGAIIDKMDALRVYSYRYLKKDETFRSNCFIHMLLCIPRAYFNAIALQRHAKNYVERLGTYEGGEIEIIPFEKLWEEILNLLD